MDELISPYWAIQHLLDMYPNMHDNPDVLDLLERIDNSYKPADQGFPYRGELLLGSFSTTNWGSHRDTEENDPIMTPINCIPIVSQLKSLGMIIFDWNFWDAMDVQADFIDATTGLSQLKSLLYLITFNSRKALLVQRRYFQFVGALIDALPIIGHIKAILHWIRSDTKGAHQAFYSSSRTLGFLLGGATVYYHWPGCYLSMVIAAVMYGWTVDMMLKPEEKRTYGYRYTKVGSFEYFFDGLAETFFITSLFGIALMFYGYKTKTSVEAAFAEFDPVALVGGYFGLYRPQKAVPPIKNFFGF